MTQSKQSAKKKNPVAVENTNPTKKKGRRPEPKHALENAALAQVVAEQTVERAKENAFRKAFGIVLPEMRKLPVAAIKAINFDVAQAGSIGLRIVENIAGRRAEMAACGPTVDLALIDALGDRSCAMIVADGDWRLAAKRSGALTAEQTEGYATRTRLVSAAENLHLNGIDTGLDLAEAKREVGVTNLAASLFGITGALRKVLPLAKGKTAVTEEQLGAAEAIAAGLHTGLASRGDIGSNAADAADLRNRSCTLFLQSVDEVMRVMTFLCWRTGDIGKVVPSIYGDTTGHRKTSPEPAPPTPAPAPAPVATSLLLAPAEKSTSSLLTAKNVTPDSPFLLPEEPEDAHRFKR